MRKGVGHGRAACTLGVCRGNRSLGMWCIPRVCGADSPPSVTVRRAPYTVRHARAPRAVRTELTKTRQRGAGVVWYSACTAFSRLFCATSYTPCVIVDGSCAPSRVTALRPRDGS